MANGSPFEDGIGMATTFQVFYLGIASEIDVAEGNETSENAATLVGNTYGGVGDPLVNQVQTLSPGSTGFSGGPMWQGYDVDNNAINETFRINGGPEQTIDGVAGYSATITYIDGSTAVISAVIFQDTSGNLYLAPEPTSNADQAALEAKPIRALSIDSLITNAAVLGGDRVNATYATCFTSGTAIRTPKGDMLIEHLKVDDMVTTMDNGPQPIRWIGTQPLSHRQLQARPNLRPILIRQGLLGATRNLLVSPQHSVLLGPDTLVRAKHLVDVPKSGIRIAHGKKKIMYIHLMFDAHQIIFAENSPSESFYPGPMALNGLTFRAKAKLRMLFPDVFYDEDLSGHFESGHFESGHVESGHVESGHVEKQYGATARPILRKSVPLAQAQFHRFL
jgi:hypothetical protein